MNLNWVKWWKFLFIIRQPQRFWKKRGCDSLSANLPPCFVPSRITNNWKTHLSQRQCHIRFYHVPQDVLFLFLTTNMDPYHRLFKHSHISHLHMLHLEKKTHESQKAAAPWRISEISDTKQQNSTFLPEASKLSVGSAVFQLPGRCCQTRALPRDTWRSLYMLPTLGRQMKYTYLCIRKQDTFTCIKFVYFAALNLKAKIIKNHIPSSSCF